MFTSIGITWWISQSAAMQPMAVQQAVFNNIIQRIFQIFWDFDYDSYGYGNYHERFRADVYFTPWCRICVYMVGLLTGLIIYTTKRKIKMNKAVVLLGWTVTVATGMSIVYGLYPATSEPRQLDVPVAAFYNAISRPLWGACVSWVIIACTSGYGGPVTTFLNWSFFLPISRLTYSTYLIHLYVIYWQNGVQERMFHYSHAWLAYTFIGHVIVSFGLGFIASLFIEWPCQEFQRKLFISGKKSKPDSSNIELKYEKHDSFTSSDISTIKIPPSYNENKISYEFNNKHNTNEKTNIAFAKQEIYSTKI